MFFDIVSVSMELVQAGRCRLFVHNFDNPVNFCDSFRRCFLVAIVVLVATISVAFLSSHCRLLYRLALDIVLVLVSVYRSSESNFDVPPLTLFDIVPRNDRIVFDFLIGLP